MQREGWPHPGPGRSHPVSWIAQALESGTPRLSSLKQDKWGLGTGSQSQGFRHNSKQVWVRLKIIVFLGSKCRCRLDTIHQQSL